MSTHCPDFKKKLSLYVANLTLVLRKVGAQPEYSVCGENILFKSIKPTWFQYG